MSDTLGYAVASIYEDGRRPWLGFAYSSQENAAEAAEAMIAGPGESFTVVKIIEAVSPPGQQPGTGED